MLIFEEKDMVWTKRRTQNALCAFALPKTQLCPERKRHVRKGHSGKGNLRNWGAGKGFNGSDHSSLAKVTSIPGCKDFIDKGSQDSLAPLWNPLGEKTNSGR